MKLAAGFAACAIALFAAQRAGAAYLKGGDFSQVSHVEKNGAVFSDGGKSGDVFAIMAQHGANAARIRVYVDPGNPEFSPSRRLPRGVSDLKDALAQAKRARAAGMYIVLSLHYSDYWTNGAMQAKPHEWENLDSAHLAKTVRDYTCATVRAFVAQGATPACLAIGNETPSGFLFPDGKIKNGDFAGYARLCKAAIAGAKKASPKTRIVIHLDDAGNFALYDWFFGALDKEGVHYDIIGASYYPFWTNRAVGEIREWNERIFKRFGKPVLYMETGYAWTKLLPSGRPGQLSHNGPYNEFSKAGQLKFLRELDAMVAALGKKKALGWLYWDPVMIPAGDTGWELGAPNVVANTTLFDFDGAALPAIRAFGR